VPDELTRDWTFLTNHARVLVCIRDDPGVRLRDVGTRVGITERAAHRIVTDLADSGYITRERVGRRNQYTVNPVPTQDPIPRELELRALLGILAVPGAPPAGSA